VSTPAHYMNYSPHARRQAWLLDRSAGPPLGALARLLAGVRMRPDGGRPAFLLIRCDHLGDLLMATPAVRALRRAHPAARIDMMVSPGAAAALVGNPDVDGILEFEAPWYEPHSGRELQPWKACAAAASILGRGYDAVVEMRGDPRMIALAALSGARTRAGFRRLGLEAVLTDSVPFDPRRSHLERNFDVLARLGVRGPEAPEDFRPFLSVCQTARSAAARLLTPYAVIAPATGRPRHNWGAANFAVVADGLRALGLDVFIVGRSPEEAVTRAVASAMRRSATDLTGRTDLVTLGAILERAAILVANDSGSVHVAAAVGCPVVAVFGPTSPALSFPYIGSLARRAGILAVALAGPTACERPCFREGCEDDHGYGAIMPATVLEACREVLDEASAGRLAGRPESPA